MAHNSVGATIDVNTQVSKAIVARKRGWRPIETAPKDGTDVLLGWFELPGMNMRRVGHWHPRENAWIDTHRVLHNQWSFPTHWHRLPEPPQ